MADTIDTVLADKKLTDLVVEKTTSNEEALELTAEKVEEALKYLKYQEGGLSADGMDAYMGFGDNKICMEVGISKAQLETIKDKLNAKVAELQPKVLDEVIK